MSGHDAKVHNENAGRLVREMWRLAGERTTPLNILAESLLVAVAMLNYPDDPRRQALIIQEIADGAADRVRAVRGRPA